MVDYKDMLPLEKARAAEEILNNPVFRHIIADEYLKSSNMALFGGIPEEREANRQNCIWIINFQKRLNDTLKLRFVPDGGSSK